MPAMKLQRLLPRFRSLHTSSRLSEADSIPRSNKALDQMLEITESLSEPGEAVAAATRSYTSPVEGGVPLRKFKRHQVSSLCVWHGKG